MGTTIHYVGDTGAGHTIKAINNMVSATTMAVTSEALALAVKAGIDVETALAVINSGTGRSWSSEYKFPTFVLNHAFNSGFSIGLMRKDVDIAIELGQEHAVPLFVAAAAQQLYRFAIGHGLGEQCHTTIATILEEMAGVRLDGTHEVIAEWRDTSGAGFSDVCKTARRQIAEKIDFDPRVSLASSRFIPERRTTMAERVRLAIVGCGGMGRRHLAGLAELSRTEFRNIDLVAVCDLNRQNAEDLADEALEHLGIAPAGLHGRRADGQAKSNWTARTARPTPARTTTPPTMLLDLGLHTLCEKPLALTIRGCNKIIAAAERAGQDPLRRRELPARPDQPAGPALLDDGAIGEPQFIMEASIGGRDDIIITPWRHQKMTGTITLDAGVHNADILQYYFGDAASAFGQARLYEKTRVQAQHRRAGRLLREVGRQLPGHLRGDRRGRDLRPDYLRRTARSASGSTTTPATACRSTTGWSSARTARSSRPATATAARPPDPRRRHGHQDERILDYAPSYRLSPVAARALRRRARLDLRLRLPGDRPQDPRAGVPRARRVHPHRRAAGSGRRGRPARCRAGLRPLRVAVAGRPVTIEEVESSAVDAYQREIDEQLGLISVVSAVQIW